MRFALAGLLLACLPQAAAKDAYELRELRGWSVHVERTLLEEGECGAEALELLDVKLYDVARMVPAGALAKLRAIPIWLSRADSVAPCSCYHPSAQWLKEHGHDARKAKAVEITNAKTFLEWTHEQPAMVLHELAHGYHDQVLGQDEASLRAAFESVKQSKQLEDVLRYGGSHGKAYALENVNEFFAEMSEAWFGTNDFAPFVRPEVQRDFPEVARALVGWWGK
ncbi:MAG: hypothetical protein IPJ19_00635 [Planctomycetes bacterium]|nr:hypothetical protein [Planctomycetota bacterium]